MPGVAMTWHCVPPIPPGHPGKCCWWPLKTSLEITVTIEYAIFVGKLVGFPVFSRR